MASMSSTASPEQSGVSWWSRLNDNRTSVFSFVFLLAGLFMLVAVPAQHDGGAVSTFTFPHDTESLSFSIEVPTVGFGVAVAVIYILTGVLGFLPMK
jgi:hypothetical protein